MLPSKPNVQTANVGLSERLSVVYLSAADGATYTWTTGVRSLKLTATSDNTLTITLPSVAEAAGMMFFAYVVTYSTNAITINDAGDDADFASIVLNAANESCVLVSDGIHWFAFDATVPSAIS